MASDLLPVAEVQVDQCKSILTQQQANADHGTHWSLIYQALCRCPEDYAVPLL